MKNYIINAFMKYKYIITLFFILFIFDYTIRLCLFTPHSDYMFSLIFLPLMVYVLVKNPPQKIYYFGWDITSMSDVTYVLIFWYTLHLLIGYSFKLIYSLTLYNFIEVLIISLSSLILYQFYKGATK